MSMRWGVSEHEGGGVGEWGQDDQAVGHSDGQEGGQVSERRAGNSVGARKSVANNKSYTMKTKEERTQRVMGWLGVARQGGGGRGHVPGQGTKQRASPNGHTHQVWPS